MVVGQERVHERAWCVGIGTIFTKSELFGELFRTSDRAKTTPMILVNSLQLIGRSDFRVENDLILKYPRFKCIANITIIVIVVIIYIIIIILRSHGSFFNN